MRQLRPIMEPRFYEYTCGSIPGRGPLYAVRAVKRWRDGYKGRRFYVAELDIAKFYDNVDTEVLKGMLRRLIRDKRFLGVLERVIDSAAPGLPLGYYTSPWLGNYYLTVLDRHVLHELHPDHYLRYMDNMFIFCANKRRLHAMVREIERFLRDELHLRLNRSRQVFRFEGVSRRTGKVSGRAINALGYIVNRMHRLHRCRRCDAAAMISYLGWLSHTDTYHYYLKYIKPKVSIQYCKRRISALAKRERSRKNDKLA